MYSVHVHGITTYTCTCTSGCVINYNNYNIYLSFMPVVHLDMLVIILTVKQNSKVAVI